MKKDIIKQRGIKSNGSTSLKQLRKDLKEAEKALDEAEYELEYVEHKRNSAAYEVEKIKKQIKESKNVV